MKTLAISRSRIVRSCHAFLPAASFMLLLLLPASCERRPLMEQSNNVYLDLELDTDIVNYEVTGLPDVMKVNFYHPDTEELLYEDFVGPHGGDIWVAPGTYHMVVYNFGTESTIIGGESQHSQAVAYTNEIPDYLKGQLRTFLATRESMHISKNGDSPDEKIVNTPDHLFVANGYGVDIPAQVAGESGQYVISARAETVVETYNITVREIRGGQYISSVSALISGMVRAHYIGAGEDSDTPATIYFDMQMDDTTTVLSGSFNTFGKHPGVESVLTLDLLVRDTGGGEHIFTFDLTDQFKDNEDQTLEVIGDFEVTKPSGGGLDPGVGDWDDEDIDIII